MGLEYALGYHIIFTIMEKSKEKLSFSKLISMSFKKLLLLYENIMLSDVKLQPLVSYSSEEGILSYKKLILKWNEMRKNKIF